MRCYKCGGDYSETSDRYELVDPYVGPIAVQGVSYFKCNQCDDVLFSVEMSQALEAARNKRKEELLSQRPIGDFISASETASFLGISRQALHKNRRIRRGFIHQTVFGGAAVYLRESVVEFKRTGDGRFPLYSTGYVIPARHFESVAALYVEMLRRYSRPATRGLTTWRFEKDQTKLEANSYVRQT